MAADSDRRDFRRQLLFSLGGVVIGLAVAGLIALLINNVVEPTMQVETQDLVKFPGETFSIWYHVDSPLKSSRHELLPQLEEALGDLLERLEVPIEDIPLPIDILVHDSPGMMQQTTLRRKSSSALYSFYSVIDLMHEEDPYSRLAELVLAFGWGRCSSQLLYQGMLMNVSFPGKDFHVPLAAAPTRLLYSLEDMFLLEKADAYEETLYQRYQSPFSQRMAMGSLEGIAEFRAMFSGVDDESADYDIADLQAASLVQYLIECADGLQGFRSIWGPGTTEALLARLACGPSTKLFDDWMRSVRDADTHESEFDYYQARFQYEAGEIEGAAQLTDTWNPRTLSSSESVLAVRTQLAVGDFEAAARFASEADSSTSETLENWVASYNGWQRQDEGMFTIIGDGTSGTLSAVLEQVHSAYEMVADALGFRESELPEHITVFFYKSDDEREEGVLIIPVISTHRTLWHISSEDNVVEEFARTLPSFVVKKQTVSNILRRGLSAVLTVDRDELNRRGCEIFHSGEWTPLWRVGFGGLPDRLFEVQTGLMLQYIVDTYGVGVIRDLWVATARIGGGFSLDTALKNILDISRTDIEKTLLDTVLSCE
ncbi:hypothetical protein ACFLSZ_05465 [Candidatus Bipolaricaulota bacterium]